MSDDDSLFQEVEQVIEMITPDGLNVVEKTGCGSAYFANEEASHLKYQIMRLSLEEGDSDFILQTPGVTIELAYGLLRALLTEDGEVPRELEDFFKDFVWPNAVRIHNPEKE